MILNQDEGIKTWKFPSFAATDAQKEIQDQTLSQIVFTSSSTSSSNFWVFLSSQST